jgi:hypothetical protein
VKIPPRVDNYTCFASFFRKNGSKRSSFFVKKLCDYHDNRYFAKKLNLGDNRDSHGALIAIRRLTLGPFYGTLWLCPLRPIVPYKALCPLYSLLSLLYTIYGPLSPSTMRCTLYGPLFPLRPYVPSRALCPLYGTLPPLRPLSPRLIYGPLPPLRRSVPSTALYPLYSPILSVTLCPLFSPLFLLRPSILSTTLCFFSSPLSPLRLSANSTALCPLYGPLSSL